MRLMKGLQLRNGIWRVRVAIPQDLRAEWGGKSEEVVSLKTRDRAEAVERGAPIYAEIVRRIERMRDTSAMPVVAPRPAPRMSREEVYDAIQKWRREEIEGDYRDFWNGEGVIGDPVSASQLRYALQHNSTIDEIEHFTTKLADILGVAPSASFLLKPDVREWFRVAWSDVEAFRDRFIRDDFNGWPEEDEAPAPVPVMAPPTTPVRSEGMLTPLQLYDRWSPVASIKLEPRNRGYVQRLEEFLGPKPISQIEPHDLARFRVAALTFPNTKRPSVLSRPFNEIIEWSEGAGKGTPKLDEATVWKWINTLNGMFGYAAKNRWIEINPAEDTMAKPGKKKKKREEYSPADITEIFSRPLFTGFDGKLDGYREKPGSVVVKDSKYWMPIVALFTGARLEEIGSTYVREVKQQDGIWFFDILDRGDDEDDRSIKNEQSRRIVPLHKTLIDLGFLEYVKAQPKDGFLFPDLTSSMTPYGMRQTPMFSKWYGRFRERNAVVSGKGMGDPKKPFHSFRHTAIRALRKNGINPTLAYLLVGHEAGEFDRMNASYGQGQGLAELKETIDMISYPTFKLTP